MMTPDIGGKGHSFKGVMAYLMHDKRQEPGAAQPATAERVAWSETRNVAGVGPHTATRVMIDYAQQASAMKAAAGVGSTGRKSKAHVYHFSLSWRADEVEDLDRAEMVRSVDAALKFMGADHLQAVIVAHDDTEHPHVHVVLNRVQADGRMWTPSFDKDKFSLWASRYERENGKIVTPNRDAKWRKIEAAQEAHPDADQRRQHVADARNRTQQARADRGPESSPDRRSQANAKSPSPGQILKDRADAQKARHKAEWKAWGDDARRERQAIYRQADAARREAETAFKAGTKGDWAQHFRDERTRARIFETRERSLGGIIRNAFDAARIQVARQPGESTVFGRALSNILSGSARREAFGTVAEGRSIRMREHMRQRKTEALSSLEAAKRAALEEHSRRVDATKAALIERQNRETADIRVAWRQHYATRPQDAPGAAYRARRIDLRPVTPRPLTDDFRRGLMAPANDYHAGQTSPAPATKGLSMTRPTRTWAEQQEDRAIMRGSEPTNPENMRRREEDAQADKPVDPFAKYRRAAAERPPGPKPERPRGPRMKP